MHICFDLFKGNSPLFPEEKKSLCAFFKKTPGRSRLILRIVCSWVARPSSFVQEKNGESPGTPLIPFSWTPKGWVWQEEEEDMDFNLFGWSMQGYPPLLKCGSMWLPSSYYKATFKGNSHSPAFQHGTQEGSICLFLSFWTKAFSGFHLELPESRKT